MIQCVNFFPNDKKCKSPQGASRVNENNRFTLRFSRPSNPDEVFLSITKDGEDEVLYPMTHLNAGVESEHIFECNIKITSKGLYFYHFVVFTSSEQIRIGCDENLQAMLRKGQDWQLTVYDADIKSSFIAGGVMYQIFVDRFNIGGERLRTKKDAIYREDWGGTPTFQPNKDGKILNNDFFGGNLLGITKKLSYIKSLGVNCIYLNPIFEARSNHKYDTANYRKIDSDFGTFDDFKDLIKKADKRGIKIILDGVFSHTGDDSIYFNKYNNYDSVGAYQSVDSPYYGWYRFRDFENKNYECWWNIDTLPNTNECNAGFDEYINGEDGIAKFWTQCGIGGWRLDVVDEIPDKFLDRFCKTVRRVNEDALILGEVWEDASNKIAYSQRRRYLQGGQLSSVTNYPLKEEILRFVNSGDASGLLRVQTILTNNYPTHILNSVMNILGTHDTVRLLTALGENGECDTRKKRSVARVKNLEEAIEKLKMATLLQFTLPGVPCIYYGDEIGLEGFEDPFNRRCFDYNNKNSVILRWYKRLGAIRNEFKDVFAYGTLKNYECSNGAYAFSRLYEGNEIVTIVNNGSKEFSFDLCGKEYMNLLTKKPFDGVVKAKGYACIKVVEPS